MLTRGLYIFKKPKISESFSNTNHIIITKTVNKKCQSGNISIRNKFLYRKSDSKKHFK